MTDKNLRTVAAICAIVVVAFIYKVWNERQMTLEYRALAQATTRLADKFSPNPMFGDMNIIKPGMYDVGCSEMPDGDLHCWSNPKPENNYHGRH